MKRAVRSIQPSLRRRNGRLGHGVLSNNLRGKQPHKLNNIRQWKRSFSSIPYDDGFHHNQHDANQSPKTLNHQRKRNRKQRQRSQVSSRDDVFVFGSIQDAQESMQDLLDRLAEIDENAPSFGPTTVESLAYSERSMNDDVAKELTRIFRDAGDVYDALVLSVEKGLLSPSRKHGKELAQLAECLLYIIGRQQPCSSNSNDGEILQADEIVHALKEVLRVLEVDWNLDVGHRHYEQAIAAACNWQEWAAASDWFEKQIDPNAGGSPVRLSIENPLALYAMARRYQANQIPNTGGTSGNDQVDGEGNSKTMALHLKDNNEPSLVAEQVMDAVQRLIMVSPQDKSTYVLAAGNALGHVGCWRELDRYRESTFLSKQYGTTLVAATVRACLLNGEYEHALKILIEEGILSPSPASMAEDYDDALSSDNATKQNLEEEWQWGGRRDRMDPLIRDLAMQVLGGASVLDHPGREDGDNDNNILFDGYDSRLALDLFWESREEGVTISHEALLGVVEACERDKDWRAAMAVLRTVVDEEERNFDNDGIAPWIVSGDTLSIAERDQIRTVDSGRTALSDLGPFLASVMRNCNNSTNFGMSLFGLRLFRTQLLRSLSSGEDDTEKDGLPPEEEISRMLSAMNLAGLDEESEEIIAASMVALSGLRCHSNAMRLYEITAGDVADDAVNGSAASLLHQYAALQQKRHGTLVLGNPWLSAHEHIGKLARASSLARTINANNNALSYRHREGIEAILARAMNSCTSSHQPELALYLLEWMEDTVFSPRQSSSAQFPHQTTTKNNDEGTTTISNGIPCGDSVTAETILALRWTKDLVGAIEMFEGILEKHAEDDLVRWRKTIVAGLSALVASGRGNDAVKVFEVLGGDARSTDSYATIGRHLSKVKDWKELIDLYRDATAEGYNSEELSLLAMLAVTSTRVDNRLRILRAIVDECATSVAGLDSKRWTKTKYWQLKRVLGFYHARLLMWWNDEDRAPLDEVSLAIKEYMSERANGMRPKNDVVRAIVAGASRHEALESARDGAYEAVPKTPSGWAELVSEVLETTRDSSIRYDPTFVDAVVRAYITLEHPGDCLEYVADVLEVDGTRIKYPTLVRILEGCAAQNHEGTYRDVEWLLRSRERSDVPADRGGAIEA